ncbi:protein kintoun [Echeneis naucrates]|uniref:protein kintoun n=1 Tax=Echeneis naucrates TaxID=173247 RepID=UPI001114360A|nr:protein kintoun [Echeneis naucrates]
MEVEEKLKELNITAEEADRLTKAFKDEKFREMLHDYVQEISDPENKRRYEEEIKLLEQERGNNIEFIHPEPFRCLKTSVNGKLKCFINICVDGKIGSPACESGVSEDGRRGQRWSLPHSLNPGRHDTDAKGNKILIYDVVFHPDTLYIASKNKRFMNIVDGTAIQGIQNAFKVTLDKKNVREMNTRYKGTPRPCVIRKPIPGYKAKEPSEQPDPLAFPYPDEKRPAAAPETKPNSPSIKNSSEAKPYHFHIQPQNSNDPTKPNYTIKYRSFFDLQDFRCSRDSARSPRPKEIVITIDMPLLKSVKDTNLEIKEKSLHLDSKKPAYRLELPLAYPVDEDKGEAKFNRQRGQLTVTLPVLPSNEAVYFAAGPATTLSDTQGKCDNKEEGTENEEDKWKEQEQCEEEQQKIEERKVEEGKEGDEENLKTQTKVDKSLAEETEMTKKGQDAVKWEESGTGKEETKGGEKKEEKLGLEEEGNSQKQNTDGQKREIQVTRVEDQKSDMTHESQVEENELKALKHENKESQPVLIAAEYDCEAREGGEENPKSGLDSTEITEEAEKTNKIEEGSEQEITDAAFLNQTSSEQSHTATFTSSTKATTSNHDTAKACCSSQVTETCASAKANKARTDTGTRNQKEREGMDEDDLPTEPILQIPEHDKKPTPAVLREVDKDGNEKVISDHSTSIQITFQNTLIYELD